MELGGLWRCSFKLEEAEEKVTETNLLSDAEPANLELLNNYVTAIGVRDLASQNYHTMLSQKARINWIKFGDANTDFFHTSIKLKQAKNSIDEIEDEFGNIVANQQSIAKILIDYFQAKFTAQPVQFTEHLSKAIPHLVTDEDNIFLEFLPSKEEIKHVVFDLNQDGAPGPDGFTGIFYTIAWDVISEDLTAAVQYC